VISARGLRLRAATAVLAIGAVSGCRGCTPSPSVPTSEIVVACENEIATLDPAKSQEPYSLRVIGQIFEGLVSLDDRNQIEPALATKWIANETFDTWTFELRPHVRFQEDDVFGPSRTREVTAADVVASLTRLAAKDSYPSFVLADAVQGVAEFQAGKARDVAGIRAVTPQIVEIRLSKPEPTFLHRLTSPWFVVFPAEAVALGPDVFGRARAPGTGPYRLVSRTDSEVVLAANPSWWKGSPKVSTLVFRVTKNDALRLAQLRARQINWMLVPESLSTSLLAGPSTPAESLGPDVAVDSFPSFSSHFVGFNCDKLDVHLRRALSFVIDRWAITSAVAGHTAVASVGTVPAGLLGYLPPYSEDLHDESRARAELAQSTFKPARDSIELLVHEKDASENVGQIIQAQAAKIGVRITIKKLEYNTVVGRMISGDTQAFVLALDYVFSAPEPILNNIFNSAKIPVPNFWHYRSTEVDRRLEDLRGVQDREKANALARDIERLVIDDAPAVFLYQGRKVVLRARSVPSVPINGHGIPRFWSAMKAP